MICSLDVSMRPGPVRQQGCQNPWRIGCRRGCVVGMKGVVLGLNAVIKEAVVPETIVHPVANASAEPPRGLAMLGTRVGALIAILVPFAGVVAAPFYVWGWGFYWTDLVVLAAMYVLTACGITIGFHRLFVHRSFETYMWVKVVFAVLGSAGSGGRSPRGHRMRASVGLLSCAPLRGLWPPPPDAKASAPGVTLTRRAPHGCSATTAAARPPARAAG